MSTLTVIAYRKNKNLCSLGYLCDSHDSELLVRTFADDDLTFDTFLETMLLDDMRKGKEMSWRAPIEFQFLIDGAPVLSRELYLRLETAQKVAERIFNAEEVQARRVAEAARLERIEAETKAKRVHDLAELQRILNTYSVQELRDSLTEFKL